MPINLEKSIGHGICGFRELETNNHPNMAQNFCLSLIE